MTDRSTKDLLLDAAQRLFARDGVRETRIRDINELAGQRNPSALHYHFGTREALLEAILARYQRAVDVEVSAALDRLDAGGSDLGIREIVEAAVEPAVATLDTQEGRDCVRIIPPLLPALSRNLRAGDIYPITPGTRRILVLLDERMAERALPERVRRERLVSYAVVFTTLMGERANAVEGGGDLPLTADEFAIHLSDTLEGLLVASSHLADEERRASRRGARPERQVG